MSKSLKALLQINPSNLKTWFIDASSIIVSKRFFYEKIHQANDFNIVFINSKIYTINIIQKLSILKKYLSKN